MKIVTLFSFLTLTTCLQAAPAKSWQQQTLRMRTYLTPSIPEGLYQLIARYLEEKLGIKTELSIETHHSGPERGKPDPFSENEIDLCFCCSPPYIWLTQLNPSPIELLSVAPVFVDQRNGGKPVYFSDVIVKADSTVKTFDQLRGGSWCYNDPESLSGYFCTLQKLVTMGELTTFFSKVVDAGDHLSSIQKIANGQISASAIDSVVLALAFKKHPELAKQIKSIEFWGPSPIQPIVVAKRLSANLKQAIADALGTMHNDPAYKHQLQEFMVVRFTPIAESDFDQERALLKACEHLSFR